MLAFLGPLGTFSHMAAQEYLQQKNINDKLMPCNTIYLALRAVNDGRADMAIVPIENSIEGSVNITLDSLALEFDLFIIDEYVLNVKQNILVKKGVKKENIKKIISHSQAIGQCSKILNDEFSGVTVESTLSTSFAAKAAAESDGTVAAIAPKISAQLYGLDIMYENCSDNKNNSTRFVVISKEPSKKITENDRTSIVFTLAQDTPGSLCRALMIFERTNINLLKIESRPIKTGLGKYLFFADIEGNIKKPVIKEALEEIKGLSEFYKFLGSYKMNME